MKYAIKRFACMAILASPFVQADSLLRVTCADEDSGAAVLIDNNPVGNCPVITAMPAGTYQVRVVKSVGDDKEQVFDQQVELVDGRPQSVDAELSAPRLTAVAVNAKARAHAAQTLESAQSGDIDAMRALAGLYDKGEGVDKSPAKAEHWRSIAAQATSKAQQNQFYTVLQQANNGDVGAMYSVAAAYDAGEGVAQDRARAIAWRQRAKETSLNERLAANGFFNDIKHYNFNDPGLFTSSTIFVPTSLFIGVVESPSVTSRQMQIRSEAVMRPATFGNPDSMIARAARRQDVVLASQ